MNKDTIKAVAVIGTCFISGGAVGFIAGRYGDRIKNYIFGEKIEPEVICREKIDSFELDQIMKDYISDDENEETIYNQPEEGGPRTPIKVTKQQLADIIEHEKETEHPMEEDFKDPYLIDISDFVNTRPEFNKITMTYCHLDETLVNDDEEIVQVDDHISQKCLDQFLATEPDDIICTFYVRNERQSTDYEIIWRNCAFNDVLGDADES